MTLALEREIDTGSNRKILTDPEGVWFTLVKINHEDTFQDRQKGRLIARIIAATRREKRDYRFDTEKRSKDLSILSKSGENMGRPLTTFMARLKENAVYAKPLVESLIARMVK